MSRLPLIYAAVLVGCAACTGSDLRGSISPSPDATTYLNVADANGGKCGPLTVDGKIWPHPIGQLGAIQPGSHTLKCGTELSITIPARTVFTFNYWGP